MTRTLRMALVGLVALALGSVQGATEQRSTPQAPAPRPDYSSQQNTINIIPGRTSPIEDSSMMREMEEKRGKALNSERQRMMVKEANQMVQTAAELQEALTHSPDKALLEEEARRAEMIEKLARNVKDRMKGSR